MRKCEDRLKRTVDQIAPSEEQREKIWNEIAAHKETHRFGWSSALRVAVAMLSVICICGLAGVGVNAATDGVLFQKMGEIFGWTEEKEQMTEDFVVWNTMLKRIPSLVSVSDEYIVFANERCLAIYSREDDILVDVVDLQELACVYFDDFLLQEEDPLTRIFRDGQKIYIYNKFEGIPDEQMYCYDMELMGREDSICLIDNEEQRQEMILKSEQYFDEHVKRTYSYMPTADFWNADTRDTIQFSENCLTWSNNKDGQFISCIVMEKEGRYHLQTYPIDLKGDAIRTEIKMNVRIEKEEKLPGFVYTGEDQVVKALVEYTLAQKKRHDMSENEVTIPAPLRFKTIDEGEDKIVFVRLYYHSYVKNGIILCSNGTQGVGIGRARLSLDKNGEYVVTEFIRPRDGEDYGRDIRTMCEGYDMDAKAFSSEAGWDDEEVRKEMLQMYITNNQIDAKYYGDYSGDFYHGYVGGFQEELKEINRTN